MNNPINRRHFIGGMAATAALSMTAPRVFAEPDSRPNSNFKGVQIGVITYSYRSMPGSAEELLKYLVECGISSVELMGEPAEQFAGAPVFERLPRRGAGLSDAEREEMQAKRNAQREELRKWRTSLSMDKYKALRKLYNDSGVDIYIVKFGDIGEVSDEEVEYYISAAKALGARGITAEISEKTAERLGPIADKNDIQIGFHNHTQVSFESWETPFSYGKKLTMNFDIGHYVAGTNESPIPVIERYANAGRILSLHIKDRKVNNGPNMPFGQGDTPLALVLQLMKRKKYEFPAHIELEYTIPDGSDAVQEVKNCVEFCKKVLE
ncbi:sugar phosphate isomerase/epimerase [candidate division KSB1 bacterium]|nr:sugar phosphate isomerase/epimerase [candidate division KSB1 bacterium]